jgi:hypothetical protein
MHQSAAEKVRYLALKKHKVAKKTTGQYYQYHFNMA